MRDMYAEEGGAEMNAQAEINGKPAVLLIGDSIRMGYCETVRRALSDTALVYYPEENCRHTHHVITMLRTWLPLCNPENVRVVLFNCGHWDVAHWEGEDRCLTALPQYQENIARIIVRLRRHYPHARIVFATTTPMNPNGVCGVNPRTTEEIRRYNEAAAAVAAQMQADVMDQFDIARDWGPEAYADYCHFTPEAFQRLGSAVADFIRPLIEQ